MWKMKITQDFLLARLDASLYVTLAWLEAPQVFGAQDNRVLWDAPSSAILLLG